MFEPIVAIVAVIVSGLFSVLVLSLRARVKRVEAELEYRQRFVTPLVKSAEELYNQINGLRHANQLAHLEGVFKRLEDAKDKPSKALVYNDPDTYRCLRVLYCFCSFLASVEAIKREASLVLLASRPKSRAVNAHIKRTTAALFSTRIVERKDQWEFNVKESDTSNYRGDISEGAQELIGRKVLDILQIPDNSIKGRNSSDRELPAVTFLKFCETILGDNDYLEICNPLMHVLNNLKPLPRHGEYTVSLTNNDVDFRWARIFVFALCLYDLVRQADDQDVVTMLPELRQRASEFLNANLDFKKKALPYFCKGYAVPKMPLVTQIKRLFEFVVDAGISKSSLD